MLPLNQVDFKHIKYNNCLEDCLKVLLEQDKIPYCYMYMYNWFFKYYKEVSNVPIGCLVDTGWNNSWKVMKDYLGYDFRVISSIQWDLFVNFLYREIEKNTPVILNCNAYDIPWSNAYHKAKIQHYCIIVNVQNDTINIYDAIYGDEIRSISLSYLRSIVCRIFCVKSRPTYIPDRREIIYEVGPNKLSICRNTLDLVENVKLFLDDLEKEIIFKDFVYDKHFDPMIIQIENYMFAIKKLVGLLSFISEDEMKHLIEGLNKSFASWKALYEKLVFYNKVRFQKITDIKSKIINQEEKNTYIYTDMITKYEQ